MTNPTLNPIDKLAQLSAQRTARTDRLASAVQSLLAELDEYVEVGERVQVDRFSLRRARLCSNIGSRHVWLFVAQGRLGFEDAGRSVCLDMALDGEGYLHGDFSCAWTGPSRTDLIEFARRAPAFVAAFIARQEADVAALDDATSAAASASELLSAEVES